MIYGIIPIGVEQMVNSQTPQGWITTLVAFAMISIGLIVDPEMLQRRLLRISAPSLP